MVRLRVRAVESVAGVVLPKYSHIDDSGFDLRASEALDIPSAREAGLSDTVRLLSHFLPRSESHSSLEDIQEYASQLLSNPEESIKNTALVGTGLIFEIPESYELQIRPRSGLAAKHQITVLNTPGTIDEGYRGELKIILINLGTKSFRVEKGMRIAQAVLSSVEKAEIVAATRGTSGFGSTGLT